MAMYLLYLSNTLLSWTPISNTLYLNSTLEEGYKTRQANAVFPKSSF